MVSILKFMSCGYPVSKFMREIQTAVYGILAVGKIEL
jgi:hypothetical protein